MCVFPLMESILILRRHVIPLFDLNTGNCALPPDFTLSSLPFSSDSYYQWYEMLCADKYWQVLIKTHFTSPAITSKEQWSFFERKPKFSLRCWGWKLCLCLISNIWWFLSFQLNNWSLLKICKSWILGLSHPGPADS